MLRSLSVAVLRPLWHHAFALTVFLEPFTLALSFHALGFVGTNALEATILEVLAMLRSLPVAVLRSLWHHAFALPVFLEPFALALGFHALGFVGTNTLEATILEVLAMPRSLPMAVLRSLWHHAFALAVF